MKNPVPARRSLARFLPSLRRLSIATACAVVSSASAFVAADSDTIFNSFNNAFYVSNGGNAYFKETTAGGRAWFWSQANMIEMVADTHDRTRNNGHRDMLSALCNGFMQYHGTDWSWNEYNDDVMWACIAFSRAYLATGNTTYRDRAKANFDMVWNRAWSSALGGGLFWRTDNQSKNACVNGPAAIAACYLYQMLGDSSYLTKAQQIFNWERSTLFNQTTGAVADSINLAGNVNWSWLFSYNSGTFVGAANHLYKLTGNRQYYKDALLATQFTRSSICTSNGLFPNSAGSGDGAGFNGIGIRWIARFVNDQNLWAIFYPWLKFNADTAWNVRRSDNLSWSSWGQATPSGTRYAFECFGSVTTLQVVPPTNPAPWFMFVNQHSGKTLDLIGGNTSNGAQINQWTYDYNGPNQRWALVPTENGDHFQIISWVSGKAASIENDSTANGAQLHAWDYVGNNPSQQWDLVDVGNGWFKIRNVRSGKVLDVKDWSQADNADIIQYNDNGTANQKFRLQPWGDYYVRASTGKYICTQWAGSTNGSRIIQYTKENNPWFKWRFQSVGEGHLRVSSLHALSRVLCVKDGSYSQAYECHLWDYNPSNVGDQKVRIRPLLNGRFKFYFVHTGMSWDIPGGNSNNDVPLHQYPDNGNSWQQFLLERVQ